jgi:hypothetical protein
MGAFAHFFGFLVKTATFLCFGRFNGTLWRWQNHRPVFQMQPAFWRKIGTVARHVAAGIRAIPLVAMQRNVIRLQHGGTKTTRVKHLPPNRRTATLPAPTPFVCPSPIGWEKVAAGRMRE